MTNWAIAILLGEFPNSIKGNSGLVMGHVTMAILDLLNIMNSYKSDVYVLFLCPVLLLVFSTYFSTFQYVQFSPLISAPSSMYMKP